MIVITALTILACSTSAEMACKARPFMTTAPACGPNLNMKIRKVVQFPSESDPSERAAYEQLADLIMAPVLNAFTKKFVAADVGQSGEDKMLKNFKNAFAYTAPPALTPEELEAKAVWEGRLGEDRMGLPAKAQLAEMLVHLKTLGYTADRFAAEMYAQIQEVNHLSLQIFEINGAPVNHDIKTADAGAMHCPDVYDASRDVGYEIAKQLDLKHLLGVNPDLCEVMIPGMPPFYMGDKTKGHNYFDVQVDPTNIDPKTDKPKALDFALVNSHGNQYNDGGLHVSVYNRRDAAGLVLTSQVYSVPNIDDARALVATCETYEFTIYADRVKLVQGQMRNDHNVGGACYIGMETDKKAIEFVHAIQMDVMPSGFKTDASQQLHVSIAALGPKGIPHYKSPWAFEQMQHMTNAQRIAFKTAHFELYAKLRKKMDVDTLTHWTKYEDAAALISKPVEYGGCAANHVLVDVLGFKTSVVSPKIATTAQLADPKTLNADNADVTLPTTMWNGNYVSKAVRENSEWCFNPKSIKEWIKNFEVTDAAGVAHPTQYVNEKSQNSLRASVSAESYYNAVAASYAGKEAEVTQDIIASLSDTIPTASGWTISELRQADDQFCF